MTDVDSPVRVGWDRLGSVGGRAVSARAEVAAGMTAEVALLAAVDRAVGLRGTGWLVGIGTGLVVHTTAARGVRRSASRGPGPADVVTLTRATIACAVAGLVAGTADRRRAVPEMVVLSSTALVLDAVDGWVARRTRSETAFGARMDGEVDAFLILVMGLQVARSSGVWVLPAALARYGFAAAGLVWPWLRRPLPPRDWRKVAAAVEGVALVAGMSERVPRHVATAGLAAGSALIAESFGRDVQWLWQRRSGLAS